MLALFLLRQDAHTVSGGVGQIVEVVILSSLASFTCRMCLARIKLCPAVKAWPHIHDMSRGQTGYTRKRTSCVVLRHGQKDTLYHFYAAQDGTPVRLHMHGNDMSSGAHFGE